MECMRKNSVSTCFYAAAAAITAKISKFHQIGGYPVGRVRTIHAYVNFWSCNVYMRLIT